MAEFGEQLRKAREAKSLTQQALAEQLYVTRQTVSRWESGDRYPDLLILRRLSVVLGVSTDELLSDEDFPQLVEKSPIIEKPLVNNLMVALYAVAVLLFVIQAGTVFAVMQDVLADFRSDGGYSVLIACEELLEAFLLAYGFVNLLRGCDTPRKNGAVLFGFFALNALVIMSQPLFYNGLRELFIVANALPYAVGAVGALLVFFQQESRSYPRFFIYFASAFGICVVLVNLFLLLRSARVFVNVNHVLSVLLNVDIYAAFCYQTHVLSVRRKLAKELAGGMSEE